MDSIAAQRILTLATESLDMMRGVTGIVKDSLDRAETWVGRLRVVGLQSSSDVSEDVDSTFEVREKEEGGYDTPSSISTNSLHSTTLSTSTTTSEWSLPSTPGEPTDAASLGAGAVVNGIGELSLGGLVMKEKEKEDEAMVEVVGMEKMDVDG